MPGSEKEEELLLATLTKGAAYYQYKQEPLTRLD